MRAGGMMEAKDEQKLQNIIDADADTISGEKYARHVAIRVATYYKVLREERVPGDLIEILAPIFAQQYVEYLHNLGKK